MPDRHQSMFSRRTLLGVLCATPAIIGCGQVARAASRLSPAALRLASVLDGMDVEHRWIAGQHVAWESGLPDGRPVSTRGRHTHCSAFVASAAKQLGVYILRPPEHGQTLLANAQFEWLMEVGAEMGWRRVADPFDAQELANRGYLVVAAYHNHFDDKPGHIAIVRPADKSADQIMAEGPDVIQAGSTNATRTSLRDGFAGHPSAWRDREVVFFAHALRGI